MEPTDEGIVKRRWRRSAAARLGLELAGIAFARATGRTPEDYARHLWGAGAAAWFGGASASPEPYLAREAEAFATLYPAVGFIRGETGEDYAELTFVRGCLGGWGKDQWGMARRWGLRKGHVCRYCREAFRVWSAQLGLAALPTPRPDDTCVLAVRRP